MIVLGLLMLLMLGFVFFSRLQGSAGFEAGTSYIVFSIVIIVAIAATASIALSRR